ncbi:MAG: transposase, partial [Novosphingobium sp.]|nr:transposase [Novosphingobium sp.]
MPRVMDIVDDAAIGLDECVVSLAERGFRPRDEESLRHAALMLRRLGNDRDFLGDILLGELAAHHREELDGNSYGPQVVMLHPPGTHDFFIRANVWSAESDHMMRASGGSSFVYGLPHDHNFDFLTIGYFGPGYWSEYYEFAYDSVAGYTDEPVSLTPTGRHRLEEGRILHYRAHRDVHAQFPADALSVSLNVMHAGGAQGWLDQYRFDCWDGGG